jgi:hypothetical protein
MCKECLDECGVSLYSSAVNQTALPYKKNCCCSDTVTDSGSGGVVHAAEEQSRDSIPANDTNATSKDAQPAKVGARSQTGSPSSSKSALEAKKGSKADRSIEKQWKEFIKDWSILHEAFLAKQRHQESEERRCASLLTLLTFFHFYFLRHFYRLGQKRKPQLPLNSSATCHTSHFRPQGHW